jgi:hypothetical protein
MLDLIEMHLKEKDALIELIKKQASEDIAKGLVSEEALQCLAYAKTHAESGLERLKNSDAHTAIYHFGRINWLLGRFQELKPKKEENHESSACSIQRDGHVCQCAK